MCSCYKPKPPKLDNPSPSGFMGKMFFGKNILLLSILFLFAITGFAQQTMTGIVTGVNDAPLSGATITVKDSKTASVTNADGVFFVSTKQGDILIISFVGYTSQEVTVGNSSYLKISLALSANDLDEVIVTGYTSQRVKEITGSVSVVKPKDLTAVPAGQVEQMLQGRVAGLNVINSAVPGAQSQVYLHGIGNFGNVTPLYIVDGLQEDINDVNPYDIESLQVLKDAGAYSIYGVRGANGAIIITTKKGKIGKTKISYDFYIGHQEPLKKGPDLLNPQEQADLEWLAFKNSGVTPGDVLYGYGPKPVLPDYLFAGPHQGLLKGSPWVDESLYNIDSNKGPIYQIVPFNKTGTDWFHQLMKPATSQNHTLSVSGGSDKNLYLLSFGYLDQPGTYLNTYLKKYTARVNTEFTIMNSIRIGENLQLSYSQNPKVGSIDGAFSDFPYLPVYDIKGNPSSYGPSLPGRYIAPGPASNHLSYQELSKDNTFNGWLAFGNAFAEVDFLKKFTFRTNFGGTFYEYYNRIFNYGSYEPPPPVAHGYPNSFNEESGYVSSWTWTNTLNYSGTFLKYNHIKILIGTEEKNNYNRTLGGSRLGYFTSDPNYRFLSTGGPIGQNNYSSAGASYLYSFISQANYDYKEKYFVSGTLRRDGSSVFGPENRFGWFPSIGAAWRMTEENFMRDLEWLNELKLRGSWGQTGYDGNTDPNNQYTLFGSTPWSSYYAINGMSSGNIQQGFNPVRWGNAKTGWQVDVVTDIGVDAVFWNGKLGVTADWYNKKSTGLLFPAALPGLLGEPSPPNVNVGDIKNTGIDLTISSKGNFSKSWGWNSLLTFSHYRNEIVKLNDLPFFDYYDVRNEVGYPIGSFFGYKVIGYFENDEDVSKSPAQLDAKPGRFKYLDANGDGEITTADQIHFGNPNPKFTLGLNIGATYKEFDFTAFFYACVGNDVLDYYKNRFNIFSPGSTDPNGKTALYDSWTPQHQDARAPLQELEAGNFSTAGTSNSYGLEKGSYLRNKTMILGYNLPRTWLQKIRIERLRIYIQAVNLFTVTKYPGLDPELSNRLTGRDFAFGVDGLGNYPNNQKQYLFGLNVGF